MAAKTAPASLLVQQKQALEHYRAQDEGSLARLQALWETVVRHGQPQRAVSNSSSALQGRTASAPPTATATATPTPTAIATATDTATAASTATEQHHDHEVANGGEPQRASSLPTGTNVLIKRNATALPDSISVEETYTTSRTYLDETEQTIAMEKTLSQPQQQQPSDGDHETQQKRQPGRHTPVSKKRQAADTPPSPDAKRSKPQKTEPKKTLSPKLKDDKRSSKIDISSRGTTSFLAQPGDDETSEEEWDVEDVTTQDTEDLHGGLLESPKLTKYNSIKLDLAGKGPQKISQDADDSAGEVNEKDDDVAQQDDGGDEDNEEVETPSAPRVTRSKKQTVTVQEEESSDEEWGSESTSSNEGGDETTHFVASRRPKRATAAIARDALQSQQMAADDDSEEDLEEGGEDDDDAEVEAESEAEAEDDDVAVKDGNEFEDNGSAAVDDEDV